MPKTYFIPLHFIIILMLNSTITGQLKVIINFVVSFQYSYNVTVIFDNLIEIIQELDENVLK